MINARPVVLIADDHPMIRLALRLGVLAQHFDAQVIEVDSFAALRREAQYCTDLSLVLLDLVMPDVDGFSALLWLREMRPQARVGVVSALDAQSSARLVRSLGGHGFIHKSAQPAEIQIALRRLLAGEEVWPPAAVTGSAESQTAERLARLTPQELRTLLMLRDGLLNKQIADRLGIAESTVKIHVSAILRKLEASTRTQAATLAQRALAMPDGVPSVGGQ